MSVLGDLSIETFLRDYWQKRPLLIRQAIPDLVSPISADELAGLACEENVEARIVIENDNGKPWQLRHGPFDESHFEKLPDSPWTLLVQGLDHWVPEVAELLDRFRFIPNWRLDDIMASYAPDGGSVGPHFDYYDVFLLQVEGRRRWQVGGNCDSHSPRLSGTPLRILSDFQPDEEWVLEPGDMLYLPPQVAHWGVAEGDCITFSVGFRSPTHEEIITSFSDYCCHQEDSERHLEDRDLRLQDNPGRIDTQVLDDLEAIIREKLLDRRQLTLWFGQFSTEPKHEDIVIPLDEPWSDQDIRELIDSGAPICWNEGSRFAYHDLGDETALFVDGERYLLRGEARELAPLLCRRYEVDTEQLARLIDDQALLELVTLLFNQGSLYDAS
ncbi:cupin domain-containing protein [Mangrovitalea sediminis]|uniref:cupin domain-containing protein n=1 Tax=Mangrovitalea sediminis TaxID=1982043 RepID=UPI000BE5C2D4|nr:cupin domain-containing protein [Mangrovitalea sediminis]